MSDGQTFSESPKNDNYALNDVSKNKIATLILILAVNNHMMMICLTGDFVMREMPDY